MDPVTHTLLGAALGASRLARDTRLGMAAAVIGANLPDVDVLSYIGGSDAALGFRRGWTHGLPALALLPALLAAALVAWGRSRRRRRGTGSLAPLRLLGISYLACWTHPALDWLNTYGMRWRMPFERGWSYGDAVFIVDPWLWLLLGTGVAAGLAQSRRALAVGAAAALALGYLVWRAAPGYLPLVAGVTVVVLAALLWRPPGRRFRERAALASLAAAGLWVGALLALHAATVERVEGALGRSPTEVTGALMVGPRPADPRRWDVVFESREGYRHGSFDWTAEEPLWLAAAALPRADRSPYWTRLRREASVAGYLSWVRFPSLVAAPGADGVEIRLFDVRYVRRPGHGFGTATVTLPPP